MTNSIAMKRRAFLAATGAAAFTAGTMGMRSVAMAAGHGTFTFGRGRETTQLDPHRSQLSSSWHIQHMVFDSLVTLDDNFEVQPSLAEAFEWQGNNLVFTLRAGAKFGNGREVTQEDVTKSLERALTSGGNPWGLMLRNRTAIKAMGDNQVVIEFSGPNNVALDAMTATLVCIMPMKEIEDGSYDGEGDMYMGTGPYMVEEHVANDRWVLKANPHYWGGAPKADTVVVRTIPSIQGIIAALRDGSIDAAMMDADPDAPALLAGIPNVSTSKLATTDFTYLAMNCNAEGSPFADKRVRQAVAYALDRDQILNFALAGESAPTSGWTQWGLTDDSKLTIRAQDLEKAKALVADAAPEKTTVKYLVRGGGALHQNIAQVVAQNLKEIGITCELETVDGGVWAKRVWGTNPSDMDLTSSQYTGFAHPLVTAHWWAPELSGFTKGYVPVNPAYTAALNKATVEADGADEVNAALQELYQIMNEEAVKIPLSVSTETIAWRSDKVDMTPSAKQSQNDVLSGIENWSLKG